MRQRSPEHNRKLEDLYLRVPPIEDGNTPLQDLNQGFIYTAESIDQNFYDTQYNSPILSFTSKRNETGVNYVYEIVVEYTATESPYANTPGLYGSNLIKKEDFFVIESINDTHDYIRGIVVDIIDIQVSPPGPGDTYTYEYNLLCNITEGDPLLMEVGDSFVWKRRIFKDKQNDLMNIPPTNTASTVQTDGVHFRWIDPTGSARKFNLRVREENQSDGSGITYFFIPGIRASGDENISLKCFIGSTGGYENTITSLQIINPGRLYGVAPEVTILGTGTGAQVYSSLNNNGSLKKDKFKIFNADSVTGEIYVLTETWEVLPYVTSYVEGLGQDLFVDSTVDLGYGKHKITLADVTGVSYGFTAGYVDTLKDKELLIHNGIQLTSGGAGYKRTAQVRIKKYDSEDIYVVGKGSTATSIPYGSYYWSVCSIFDEENKNYTEWSPEVPLTVY